MQDREFGAKYKCFSKNAGLTIEACMNEAKTLHTVNIELAKRIDSTHIDWENKITLQLDAGELVEALQTLLAKRPELDIRYHGPKKSKSLRISHQQTSVYFAAVDGERRASIPLGPGDVYQATALLLRQLSANTPGLEIGDALALVMRLPVPRTENQ